MLLLHGITYLLFFALLWLAKTKKGIRLVDERGFVTSHRMLLVLHFAGIILFGVLPFLWNPFSLFTVSHHTAITNPHILSTALLTIAAVVFSLWIAKKNYRKFARNIAVHTPPGAAFTTTYFMSRILFICSYESWFRGGLLHDCITAFGEPLAIVVNVGVYTLLHSPNGKREMLACIPFGILLCSLSTLLGTAFSAIVIHLALTLSYEISMTKKFKNLLERQYEGFNNRRLRIPGQ